MLGNRPAPGRHGGSVPGLVGRLVRTRDYERERAMHGRVRFLYTPLFKAHMQQCRTLR
jgi:hypothetical protein